jgi:hypothetical protein
VEIKAEIITVVRKNECWAFQAGVIGLKLFDRLALIFQTSFIYQPEICFREVGFNHPIKV